MKKIKVSVIDKYTLKLEEDGKKGEIIDLNDVIGVDTRPIIDKINSAHDEVYNKELAKVKLTLEQEYKLKTNNDVEPFKLKILQLEEQIKNIETTTTQQLQLKYTHEIAELKHQIEKVKQEKELELTQKINLKELEIRQLLMQNENTKQNFDLIKERELNELKNALNEKITSLQNDNAELKRARSALSTKAIGEDLEIWCDNEYQSQALAGLENVTWEKDNNVIAGAKADYIYKVYASNEKNKNELLTSVILEMKSEDPLSTNTQSIPSILAKLDKDRNNKKVEYAFLVSELKATSTNALPIKKVNAYEKMYMVRPEYFLTMLNIVTAFGLKYKDLLIAKEKERIAFKDFEDIIIEFEEMKNDILEKSIKYIESQLNIIKKQSETIEKSNQQVLKAVDLILKTHLQTVINKINNFNIEKINTKTKAL